MGKKYMYIIDEDIEAYSDEITRYVADLQRQMRRFNLILSFITTIGIPSGDFHNKLSDLSSILDNKIINNLDSCKLKSGKFNLTEEYISNIDKEDQSIY